jgi:thiol-disulfide isomerase/thioredoxin
MSRVKSALLLSLLAAAGAISGVAPGRIAELTLRDLKGQRVRLRDYAGRIVVLNFWATWCEPCAEEMPRLVSAEKEYRSCGVVFIGASLDDRKTRRRVPEFVSTYQITFPVWIGATGENLAKLGMGDAVPSTAFIDRNGSIVARIQGSVRPDELRARIEWLLGDRTGPRHVHNRSSGISVAIETLSGSNSLWSHIHRLAENPLPLVA